VTDASVAPTLPVPVPATKVRAPGITENTARRHALPAGSATGVVETNHPPAPSIHTRSARLVAPRLVTSAAMVPTPAAV